MNTEILAPCKGYLSRCLRLHRRRYVLHERYETHSSRPLLGYLRAGGIANRRRDFGYRASALLYLQGELGTSSSNCRSSTSGQTVTSPSHEHRSYDIIFDFTCFTMASQLPLQWLKFAYEVIPSDIRGRFDTAHILTPNLLATKYLKRLYNLSSGTYFSEGV